MSRTKTRLTVAQARKAARAVKQQRTAKEAEQLAGHKTDRLNDMFVHVYTMDRRSAMQRLNDGEPVTTDMLQELFAEHAKKLEALREHNQQLMRRIEELEMPRSRKVRRWIAGKVAPKAQPATQCAGAAGLRYIADEYIDDE